MNWLAELWGTFSLWTSTQPTFVQVAIGMGLAKKHITIDDDAPPFAFR